jgi:hypothetical protein
MRSFRSRICVCLFLSGAFFPLHPAYASSNREFLFTVSAPSEGVAEITASAPGASWGKPGAEASVATVYLDGEYNQDIVIDHGSVPWTYRVFLGPLTAGSHRLRIERNARWSAAGAGLDVREVHTRVVSSGEPGYAALAHAPVLYARADTVGHFSDVPLLMWYEVFPEAAGKLFQYSFIFTNEDAGTPTPALMARWGRGTDIEYAYRVVVDASGKAVRETFQGFHHDEVALAGKHLGDHPYLLVATPNNVFADTGASILQYRMLPVEADLSHHSREELMDLNPWTYRIMAEELEREGKIRPYGVRSADAAGDPRSYLYLEMDAQNKHSGLAAWVKLKGDSRWYSSYLGYPELAIDRSGWFRTTVELPPGAKPEAIEFIGVECLDLRDPFAREHSPVGEEPESILQSISKAFMLDSDYKPRKSILDVNPSLTLHPGDFYTFVPEQKR